MSDLEDRLRAGLRAEAQRTQPQHLRELQVPARRRGGARRWLAPAAALVAVAVIATVVGVVAGDRHDSGPARPFPSASALPGRPSPSAPSPSTTAPAAAAMPPFYLSLGPGEPTSIVVCASASGAVIDSRPVPAGVPAAAPGDPESVYLGLMAAAADDRTFVISVHRPQVLSTSATITWFYRLTLAADGRPGALQRLPLTIQPGAARYQAYAMALSPDGATLAVAVGVTPGYQTRQHAAGHAAIELVSLRTGAKRTWTAPASTQLQDLSWVSGTTLGFSWESALSTAAGGYQVRTLDTASPAGDLMKRSRPVALATAGPVMSALLTDGGRTVVAFTSDPRYGGAVLAEFSARTGRPLQVLGRLRGGAQVGGGGTVLSADPAGQHLLIAGAEATAGLPASPPGGYLPSVHGQVFGRVDDGRFTLLPYPVVDAPVAGVW
jgi:hypothetical protein